MTAFFHDLLATDTLIQGAVVLTSLLAARLILHSTVKRGLQTASKLPWYDKLPGRIFQAIMPLIIPLAAILFLRIGAEILAKYNRPDQMIDIVTRLLTAWIIIRFAAALLQDSRWARLFTIIVWMTAALHILDVLKPMVALLDQLAIDLGGVKVSLLLVFKGILVFTVLLKGVMLLSAMMEKRIFSLDELTPSAQVLLSKAFKVSLLAIAVVVAIGSLGINLSAFAFIGGAIGLGIGFGLQKVVSNLVSGVILLLDRSIKPGDVIEIGSTYGRIQSLGARYVSVMTRDKTEYLIPNEDLITSQVINWSFSSKLVRLKIVVGVAYDSDVREVMRLMIESASSVPRVLATPRPVCQLKNFGDNAIDMELRVWIRDPENGIANVGSAIRLALWDAFKTNQIEIPFPQRDVHIKK